MTNMEAFRVAYDRETDVLYISTPGAPAHRGVEDRYGMVWRYDRNGELIGVTIVDFHDQWTLHRNQIAHEFSKRSGVSERQAEVVFDHAIETHPRAG
jgi:uncharacterized protein YuzE